MQSLLRLHGKLAVVPGLLQNIPKEDFMRYAFRLNRVWPETFLSNSFLALIKEEDVELPPFSVLLWGWF